MMKRVALLVLILAVLVLAAACGADEPAVEVEPTIGEATGLDGATILTEKCDGVCHSLDRIEAAEYDAVGWAEIITQMNEKGANVSDDEAAALAEYLSLQ
jgi:ABC-type glycerol-3-phosphate transport system substrate-binding protein